MLGVFGEERQLRIGRELDDDGAAAGKLDLARFAVALAVEVQVRQKAECKEDQPGGDERGKEVTHSRSPVQYLAIDAESSAS